MRPRLDEAAALLRRGELVAFPTETVYGLGARALDPRAVRRVYRVKGRPADNPLILHIGRFSELARVAREITPLARRLARAFWPGPLTLVLRRAPGVPRAATAGLDTVAVRMPAHPVALALLRRVREPLAAPSANRSGRPSPTRAEHVAHDLGSAVALILDGGPCREGVESTIVDARGARPVLLRPGAVPRAAVERAAGERLLAPGRAAPAAPGRRHRHYAPSCPVVLVAPRELRALRPRGRRPGLLCRSAPPRGRWAFVAREPGALSRYARRLFAAMREAEAAGVDRLFVETVPESGLGEALMDRLRRAARR